MPLVHECLCFLSLLLEGLKEETKQLLSSSSKKKGKGGAKNESSKSEETKPDAQPVTIHLNFKRYIYDPHKKMVQSWPSVWSFLIRAERRTGITDTTKVWDMEQETSCVQSFYSVTLHFYYSFKYGIIKMNKMKTLNIPSRHIIPLLISAVIWLLIKQLLAKLR